MTVFTPLIFYYFNDIIPVNSPVTGSFSVTLRMIGLEATLTASFYNDYGQLIDPRVVLVILTFPDTTEQVCYPENVALGTYSYTFPTPLVGVYDYRFEAFATLTVPSPIYA